jgi:hypothetical protein
MKLRTAFLAMCVLMSSAVVAHAQDGVKVRDHRTERKPKVVQPVWDSNGWTALGKKVVQGRRDTDTIKVGVKEGKFSKITLVVEDSDLELFDIVIHFGNGETYSPTTRHYFKEGSRTGVIDLPGEARYIKKVVFKYGNLPRRGRATVQLWAFEVVEPPPPRRRRPRMSSGRRRAGRCSARPSSAARRPRTRSWSAPTRASSTS